jgi:hypothetical protein
MTDKQRENSSSHTAAELRREATRLRGFARRLQSASIRAIRAKHAKIIATPCNTGWTIIIDRKWVDVDLYPEERGKK